MYESFYALREKPFSLTPDPAFLYPTRTHLMALTVLEYGLANGAAFSVITGEVGCGKTTLVRQWLAKMDQTFTVGLITNTSRSFARLLQWVCYAFGLEHRGKDDAELYEMFVAFLVAQYAQGRRVTLIVDEAQNLDAAMLEELRVLSNINADRHFVLQTFLVGQPELRDLLQQPVLRQLAQRISVDYHLPVLTVAETYRYIRHRLHVAGGNPDLLHGDAILLAHGAAGGVPRLVNQLCDTALVYGYAEQAHQVDADLMRQVIADRRRGGLWPGAEGVPDVAIAAHS